MRKRMMMMMMMIMTIMLMPLLQVAVPTEDIVGLEDLKNLQAQYGSEVVSAAAGRPPVRKGINPFVTARGEMKWDEGHSNTHPFSKASTPL
jgi:hypothetical protein